MTTIELRASARTAFRFSRATFFVAALLSLSPLMPATSLLEAAGPPVRSRPETSEETLARTKRLEKIKHDASVRHGKELFLREWQPRDPSSTEPNDGRGDGLGPLFNERSCAACHRMGSVGGAGGQEHNVQLLVVERLPAGDKWETTFLAQREFLFPTATSDTFLLHRFGTAPGYERWRRERLSLVSNFGGPEPVVSDEARVRHLKSVGLELAMVPGVRNEGNGLYTAGDDLVAETPTLAKVKLEERNTPALFGAGLIEKVPEETLAVIVTEQHAKVRGRVPYTAGRKVGRFGWKGQHESLLEFNTGACAAELGLDTAKVRQAKSPSSVAAVAPYANQFNISKGIDVQPEEIASMTDYVASLPAPTRPDNVRRHLEFHAGEKLFEKIGCAECHRPNVGDVEEIYSDLLLHDIGLTGTSASYYGPPIDLVGNGDPKRSADGNEFRTPPLWGVADSAPYLHDGRAKTLSEAIAAHGGQAADSSQQYALLNPGQKKQLLAFLGSLKAPRGLR